MGICCMISGQLGKYIYAHRLLILCNPEAEMLQCVSSMAFRQGHCRDLQSRTALNTGTFVPVQVSMHTAMAAVGKLVP